LQELLPVMRGLFSCGQRPVVHPVNRTCPTGGGLRFRRPAPSVTAPVRAQGAPETTPPGLVSGFRVFRNFPPCGPKRVPIRCTLPSVHRSGNEARMHKEITSPLDVAAAPNNEDQTSSFAVESGPIRVPGTPEFSREELSTARLARTLMAITASGHSRRRPDRPGGVRLHNLLSFASLRQGKQASNSAQTMTTRMLPLLLILSSTSRSPRRRQSSRPSSGCCAGVVSRCRPPSSRLKQLPFATFAIKLTGA
jgi:hypothetical protein